MATVDPRIYDSNPEEPELRKMSSESDTGSIISEGQIHDKWEDIVGIIASIKKMKSLSTHKNSIPKLENLLTRVLDDFCNTLSEVKLGNEFFWNDGPVRTLGLLLKLEEDLKEVGVGKEEHVEKLVAFSGKVVSYMEENYEKVLENLQECH